MRCLLKNGNLLSSLSETRRAPLPNSLGYFLVVVVVVVDSPVLASYSWLIADNEQEEVLQVVNSNAMQYQRQMMVVGVGKRGKGRGAGRLPDNLFHLFV